MQESVFDAARRVASADVARQEGLQLRQHGSRSWTCCPLHQEKTPSLCFYPDGGWYCFGCHAGGDAVDLFAALHHTTRAEAARTLAGSDRLPRALPHASKKKKSPFLDGTDDDGFTWDRLCAIRNKAQETLARLNDDTAELWEAVAARAFAEERMDNMLLGEL